MKIEIGSLGRELTALSAFAAKQKRFLKAIMDDETFKMYLHPIFDKHNKLK